VGAATYSIGCGLTPFATGNIDFTQVKAGSRLGVGPFFQMAASNTFTAGHQLFYDCNGNATDGGAPGAGLTQVIGLVIDGGGAVPATGAKGFIAVPFNCTIVGWTVLADTTGSAQFTVSRGTYSSYPTVTSIVASAPPNISSAQKNTTTTLTGWTTSLSAGDILSFNLNSVSTVTRLVLELQVTRN